MRTKWTPELDAALGTKTDAEIASELGVTRQAVHLRRVKLGIKAQNRERWTAEFDALLGVKTDEEVAQAMGISAPSVAKRRKKLGTGASRPEYARTAKKE